MKRLILTLVGIVFALGIANQPTESRVGPATEDVYVDASAGYVPTGFDDNDNIQIVIEGMYTDGCYKWQPSEWEISNKDIYVYPKAVHFEGENIYCPMMMVPFEETINVGHLESGTYNVYVEGEEVIEKELYIKPAPSNTPDDFTYAPIKRAYRLKDKANTIRLEGEWQNTCAFMENVDAYDPENQVVAVLPKANYDHIDDNDHDGVVCAEMKVPFTADVELEHPDVEGRILIHIRSQNGQAMNLIEDF